VAHATGIDLLGAWLDLVAGKSIDLTPRREDVASIRFLTAATAGTLKRVDVVYEKHRLATVRQIAISREVGSAVRPAQDAYDRLGFVIASGPDRGIVARELDRTLKMIHFDVEAVRHAVA
jgi:biotin carboxylase